jgi:PAS domain S-box-containing protein
VGRVRRIPGASSASPQPAGAPVRDDLSLGLFRTLAARSTDVIYRYRLLPTMGFDYLSPSVEALTGYSITDFQADPLLFQSLVHPDDVTLVTEGIAPEEGATARWICKGGEEIWVEHRNVLIQDGNGETVAVEGIARDVTAQVLAIAALKESELRFRTLLDVVGMAAMMVDTAGRVTYVNEHGLAATGWTRHEVIGLDWFEVFVPERERATRRWAFARGLRHGFPVTAATTGVLARDGSMRQFAVSSTVLHDSVGRATGVASIGADLTLLQTVELERDRLDADLREAVVRAHAAARQRAEIVSALQGMGPLATFEQTAQVMCEEMVKLTGVDMASINAFEGSARLCVIASSGSPVLPGEYLPRQRATYLWDRARQGPWTETWTDRTDPIGKRSVRAGIVAAAFSPIATERGLVGVLLLGTKSVPHLSRLVEQLPAAVEFAAVARSLLGAGLEARHEEVALRARIEQVVRTSAFHPVFQPIVDLATLEPIGYEALTRFSSRQRPDHVFAAAHRTGLGLELELATLAAALKESARLPGDAWLSLNVSPGCVLAGTGLARLLDGRTRPIVLEITEHDAVPDYAALREAIVALGPDVRTAVDDAGAGVANFRHLVELRPDFVKIDASLVKNVNADLTRQALIVGLHHFARKTGHSVVAEGVETDAELATLRGLDVRYGQGFLLGRPVTVDRLGDHRHEALPEPRRIPKPRVLKAV